MSKPGTVLLLALFTTPLFAQTEDTPRGLWNTEFQSNRANPQNPRGQPRMLGVTLWRMRAPRAADQARIIIHEPDTGTTREMTPERISADSRLYPDDRVRLTIESAVSGYLYVASCELYADGSRGTPYLLFPSRRILGGNNRVRPGMVVELPEPSNRRPYFTLKRGRADHVSESLIVLVSAQPISGLMVDQQPVALQPAQVERWIKDWGAGVKMIQMEGSVGQSWTAAEKAAASGAARLQPGDPAPQRIYRAAPATGQPIVIALDLKLVK